MYGIKLSPYKPTGEDVAFTKNIITELSVGGVWGIPRCSVFYKKVSDSEMKLDNYLTPELATHMVKTGMVFKGMEPFSKVEDLKLAQAKDHQAFMACCKKLNVKVDDSALDENGHR